MEDSVGSIGLGTRDERNIGELQWRTFKKKVAFFCFSSEASQIIFTMH